MIQLTEEFRTKHDGYCWHLEEKYFSTKRDTGEQVEKWKTTYHASISQVCMKIADILTTRSDTVDQILDAYKEAVRISKEVSVNAKTED